ncbi:MAG: hypothetical protein KDG58_13130, partial [Anaerolineae bacterium]|nr:hypothetical protein [Anaerolineae bacterium]
KPISDYQTPIILSDIFGSYARFAFRQFYVTLSHDSLLNVPKVPSARVLSGSDPPFFGFTVSGKTNGYQ